MLIKIRHLITYLGLMYLTKMTLKTNLKHIMTVHQLDFQKKQKENKEKQI